MNTLPDPSLLYPSDLSLANIFFSEKLHESYSKIGELSDNILGYN